MLESTVLRELRRALRRQGIWGTRAERLLQEWTDHVYESAAERIADGTPAPAAEQAAWKALGQPQVLAASAARQLTRASWLGRHPWLAGLVLPLGVWLACITLLFIVVTFIILENFDSAYPWLSSAVALRSGELVFNWLPWLLSLAWLVRLARTLPGGWKQYWITAGTLALLTPSLFIDLHPPQPGFHYGHFEVGIVGLPGAILGIILKVCHMMPTSHGYPTPLYPGLIQIATYFIGLFALRAWSRSTFDRTPPRSA